MNLLDVAIGLLAVGALVGGWRLGLLTRALSWVGMGLGIFVALRLLPVIVEWLHDQSRQRMLIVAIVVLLAGALAGQAIGFVVGARLRPQRREQPIARGIDAGLGAVAGIAGMLTVVWLMLPVVGSTPGWPAEQARSSVVVGALDRSLPDPPDSMQALRSLIGEEGFPAVFDALRPTPDLGPPPAATGLDQATAARVARSVLRIEGIACNRVQEGTGFVAAPDVVVTNAHVVSGESRTEVIRDDGERLDAEVVVFDPKRDLAVLAVAGLGRPPLPVGQSAVEQSGGVFGHPGGGPLRIAPFAVGGRLDAIGRDIYGTSLVRRDVLELRAGLRPGDSGSALVDPAGAVVGVAFAIAPDRPDVAYALSTDELRVVLDQAHTGPVSTGACAA